MRDSLTAYRQPLWKSPIILGVALVAVVVAGIAALIAVAASSTPNPAAVYASYGQTVSGRFDCYYIESPAEVANDIALGYCPRNSVAVAAPVGWQQSHWYIYDSDSYVTRVVPVSYRNSYRNVYIVNFSRTYSSSISQYSANRNTSGYTAPRSVTTRGGGSLRGSCAESMTTVQLKGGTNPGSGSSSGSRNGGSLRSGTSGGTAPRIGVTSGSRC